MLKLSITVGGLVPPMSVCYRRYLVRCINGVNYSQYITAIEQFCRQQFNGDSTIWNSYLGGCLGGRLPCSCQPLMAALCSYLAIARSANVPTLPTFELNWNRNRTCPKGSECVGSRSNKFDSIISTVVGWHCCNRITSVPKLGICIQHVFLVDVFLCPRHCFLILAVGVATVGKKYETPWRHRNCWNDESYPKTERWQGYSSYTHA